MSNTLFSHVVAKNTLHKLLNPIGSYVNDTITQLTFPTCFNRQIGGKGITLSGQQLGMSKVRVIIQKNNE